MSWELLIQILVIVIAVAASVDRWIETYWKGKWATAAFAKEEKNRE